MRVIEPPKTPLKNHKMDKNPFPPGARIGQVKVQREFRGNLQKTNEGWKKQMVISPKASRYGRRRYKGIKVSGNYVQTMFKKCLESFRKTLYPKCLQNVSKMGPKCC